MFLDDEGFEQLMECCDDNENMANRNTICKQ